MGPIVWLSMGGLLVFLLFAGANGQTRSTYSYIYTQTPRYDLRPGVPPDRRFPEGAMLLVSVNGVTRELAPGFAASAYASVSFDGKHVLFAGRRTHDDPWSIWEAPFSGGAPRRITSFEEDAVAPLYLPGERVVYARRAPAGFQLETASLDGSRPERLTYGPGDHIPTAVLRDGRVLFDAPHPDAARGRDVFSIFADGSGVQSYRCDHGRDRHSGVELSSGDIVFETGGMLARFTSARAVQMEIPAIRGESSGRIAEPAPGEWLLSYRPTSGMPFGIYSWRPGSAEPAKVSAAGGLHAVQPVVVGPRPVPKRHPSALGDRNGANLLCLNVYASRSPIRAGSVASVRVWALDDAGAAVALGQAPVESDGSFFVEAPSERAIRFELLDRLGKTLAEEKGWFWARRGEQRVCVGCHAGPERSPENATPAVLLRNAKPVKMILPPAAAGGTAK